MPAKKDKGATERQERIERLYPAPEGHADPLVQEEAAKGNLAVSPTEGDGEVIEREITDSVGTSDNV